MRLPDPIANTTTEAYLAYKAGVLAVGDLKPKLYEPYIHLDAWLAYWTGLTKEYPIKNVGKNLFNIGTSLSDWFQTYHDGVDINSYTINRTTATIENNKLVINSYDNTGWTWISRWVSLKKNTEYVISGKNTQAIKIVGLNSKEASARGALIKLKNKAPDGGTTTFNTGDYNYYAISFYPGGADDYFEDIQIEKGSAATAYEPYTGEPEMLTDEEAYIAYLSGVTDTYPEEFRDPADIRVAAYLRYLISARWGRPEYPVTNEEFYLSLQNAPYIPSGDPSTDIEIEGTAKAPFGDVKMYGDTFQQTWSGKNLMLPKGSAQEKTGITITPNSDGSFTLNGKATATTDFYFAGGWNNRTISYLDMPSGDYTISLLDSAKQQIASPKFRIELYDRMGENSSRILWLQQSMASPQSKTLSSPAQMTASYISIPTDQSFTNEKFYIQLEKSSTATSFEPYVGGVPSPNPDYPQPIQTVTGSQKVRVVGKNLFVPPESGSNKGVTYTRNEDGTFDIYGKATGGESLASIFVDEFDIKSGDSLTLSCTHPDQGVRYRVEAYNGATWLVGIISQTSIMPKTITIPANANRLRFSIGVQEGDEIDLKNFGIQLEKGTATAYEPYSSNDYEINLGKNLFSSQIVQGYYAFANGGYSSGGTSYVTNKDKISVTPGATYTISANKGVYDGSNYNGAGVVFFNNGTFVSSILRPENGTFTVPAGANQVVYNFYKGSSDSSITPNDITWVQLELGSTATAYAPYFEPIELCKLGAYQDYIWKDGEDWKFHQNYRKITGLGDDSWIWDATVPRFSKNGAGLGIAGVNADVVWDAVSNKFIAGAFDQVYTNKTNGMAYSPSGFISVVDTSWTDEATGRASLLGGTIYCRLRVPTDTTITNQALIDQLEALVSGGAENGTTYIKVSATDPNLPGLLYVEAPKYD